MTPEGAIQNQICSWLALQRKHCMYNIFKSEGRFDVVKKRFILSRNVHRKRGWADIIGIWKGRPLAIEVKSKTGRLAPHQKSFLDEWASYGGIAMMARSVEDVMQRLAEEDLRCGLRK